MSSWSKPASDSYTAYGRPIKTSIFDLPPMIRKQDDALRSAFDGRQNDERTGMGYARMSSQPDLYFPTSSSSSFGNTPISSLYHSSITPTSQFQSSSYGGQGLSARSMESFQQSEPQMLTQDPRTNRLRHSPDSLDRDYLDSPTDGAHIHYATGAARNGVMPRPMRRPSNRDEFDGVNQYLPPLNPAYIAAQERDIPHLPTNLVVQEQDEILARVNDRLSRCAYDFVAKYEFPIPVDPKMRPVTRPEDREWTEWVYLLKRLATKRRIPARLLYQGQIKQLVTVLENSLEMRHAAKHQSRPLKDDRNVLQLISAGIQVAKILKDAPAVEYLDRLYVETDEKIVARAGKRYR